MQAMIGFRALAREILVVTFPNGGKLCQRSSCGNKLSQIDIMASKLL
jgi:hypothetical protein